MTSLAATRIVAGGLALLAVALPRRALACGASTGGEAGINGCSLAEHDEEMRPRWHVGAAYAFTSTGLHFTGGPRVDQIRNSTLVDLDYAPTPRLTVQAGAGAFLGGSISAPAGRYAMAPGFAGAVGASYRVLDASGAIPFVLLDLQLSYANSSTGDVGYNAFDLRGGLSVGTTFWRVFTPYVVGRAFGGPVYWRYLGTAIVGTDDHHWQVGAGFSLRLARRVDLFAEGVPLGEQGAVAGAGFSF
jgi:hypothetical protein